MRTSLRLISLAALALLAPAAYASVACTELATDPANGLLGAPNVKSVDSGIVTRPISPFPPGGPTVTYCEVNLLYGTNPEQNINIRVGLPLNSVDGGSGGVEGAWNGRTQGIGGGGCSGSTNVGGPVSGGYVGSGNDTGHSGGNCAPGVNEDGTYNFQFINDFIRNGMKQQILFSKAVAKTYYAMQSAYNYWSGCSTGGRQGYVLAQELGDELDGILANAPAIYWTRFQTEQMWGQIVMNELLGDQIPGAKLSQATTSAVDACDMNDGVADRIIDDPRTCSFSAMANVCGMPTAPASNCLSLQEADAIDMIWDGPRNPRGNKIWFGLDRGTNLSSLNGNNPFGLGVIQLQWNTHDRNFDWQTVSIDGYAEVAQAGSRNIADVTDTFGNLDTFRQSGGKLLTLVGMNDQLIMPRGVVHYYRQLAARYSNHGKPDFKGLQGFYRLFRVPGAGHCGVPQGFPALVDWVEHGIAPTQIIQQSASRTRPVCPYPQTAVYDGVGDPNLASSFSCGGNLEKLHTVCDDVLTEYKNEVDGDLDYAGMGVNRVACENTARGPGR